MLKRIMIGVVLILVGATLVGALDVPTKMNFQGRITPAPATTPTVLWSFASATSGFNPLSISSYNSTTGVFDGSMDIPTAWASDFSATQVWIKINGGAAMGPQPLMSVPYAYKAERAAKADGMALPFQGTASAPTAFSIYNSNVYGTGIRAVGGQFGLVTAATAGATGVGVYTMAPKFGAWGIANNPYGNSIGVVGQNMGQLSSPYNAPPWKTIGVYGGSDGVGVMGGGTIAWAEGTDPPTLVTKEAANIGVAGLGKVAGVFGLSTVAYGVSGLGATAGVAGMGKYGSLGIGLGDGGVGVVGYHNANKRFVGGLGSFWLSSSAAKIAAGASGVVFQEGATTLLAQGALGTYYGTDKLAGVYGRVENGASGAGVVGIGGSSSHAGYFSSDFPSAALYVKGGHQGVYTSGSSIALSADSGAVGVDVNANSIGVNVATDGIGVKVHSGYIGMSITGEAMGIATNSIRIGTFHHSPSGWVPHFKTAWIYIGQMDQDGNGDCQYDELKDKIMLDMTCLFYKDSKYFNSSTTTISYQPSNGEIVVNANSGYHGALGYLFIVYSDEGTFK
jgi:hypothetical protein